MGAIVRESRRDDGLFQSPSTLSDLGQFLFTERSQSQGRKPTGVLPEIQATITYRLRTQRNAKEGENCGWEWRVADCCSLLGNMAVWDYGFAQTTSTKILRFGPKTKGMSRRRFEENSGKVWQSFQLHFSIFDGMAWSTDGREIEPGSTPLDVPRWFLSSFVEVGHC